MVLFKLLYIYISGKHHQIPQIIAVNRYHKKSQGESANNSFTVFKKCFAERSTIIYFQLTSNG